MLDLQPIKARLASATPGPWESAELQGQSRRNSFFSVAVVGRREVRADIPCQAQPDECDADLVAHAPTDLAALVAEVERLRSAIALHRKAYSDRWATPAPDLLLWGVLDA